MQHNILKGRKKVIWYYEFELTACMHAWCQLIVAPRLPMPAEWNCHKLGSQPKLVTGCVLLLGFTLTQIKWEAGMRQRAYYAYGWLLSVCVFHLNQGACPPPPTHTHAHVHKHTHPHKLCVCVCVCVRGCMGGRGMLPDFRIVRSETTIAN